MNATLMFSTLLLLSLLMGPCRPYQYRKRVAIHLGHENECFVEELGEYRQLGETFYVNDRCESGQCEADTDNKHLMTYSGCGLAMGPPHCVVRPPVNASQLNYPQCCPTIFCPIDTKPQRRQQ